MSVVVSILPTATPASDIAMISAVSTGRSRKPSRPGYDLSGQPLIYFLGASSGLSGWVGDDRT